MWLRERLDELFDELFDELLDSCCRTIGQLERVNMKLPFGETQEYSSLQLVALPLVEENTLPATSFPHILWEVGGAEVSGMLGTSYSCSHCDLGGWGQKGRQQW